MGGHLVPQDMWFLDPAALNFVATHAAVQSTHRWLAIATGSVVLALWWRATRADLSQRGHLVGHAVGAMMVLQITLGIATLLSVVAIPLAAAHQAGALTLIALLVWLRHEVKAVS